MTLWLRRLGAACAQHPWQTIGGWLAFAVLVTVVAAVYGGSYTTGGSLPGSATQRADAFLARHFPGANDESAIVVVHAARPLGGSAGLAAVTAAVRRLPLVAPGGLGVELSGDRRTALVSVPYTKPRFQVPDSALAGLQRAADAGQADGVRGYVTGLLAYDLASAPTGTAEIVGICIALLVLAAGFGSGVAALLPMVAAGFSITVGLALVRLLATGYIVNDAAPSLATMIGLGVGIDYALFIVTRHRESLAAGSPPIEAAAAATATAGSSVLYAGITVIAAIVGLSFAGIPVVTSLGAAAALVVAVTVIAALTLLPALLALAGHRINALRLYHLPFVHHRDARLPTPSWWGRWARHVERRPKRYAVASAGLLILLALPLAAIRLGQPDGASAPVGSADRTSYQLAVANFGAGALDPMALAVALPGTGRIPAILTEIRRGVAAAPGVASVGPARLDAAGDAALMSVQSATSIAAQASLDLVSRLRAQELPRLAAATGSRLYLTGRIAGQRDIAAQVGRRLPLFVGVVLAVSFLLLLIVFRSVLVPLKAVVMNVLSIAAAYGVTVAVFEWGWLRDVVGLSAPVPIVQVVPMFMFAIVFGLSMDYEVFLLSRIREEWTHSRDSRGSVVIGLTATARVITAAALIMITIFCSFITSTEVVVKMMGFGLAIAVLVDATVIRLVLVPATMALLGDLNWWLPGFLDRILPHVDIDGSVPITYPPGVADGILGADRSVEEGVPR
ncbi:MAG TPA: MMPL family transporter [Mycobacteriales bacterium]|nr:MMPL family transporter [Mycobacteriales bacterium]